MTKMDIDRSIEGLDEESAADVNDVTRSTTGGSDVFLDVAAAIRAGESIAAETSASGVIRRLLRVVLDNAGAEKILLMLDREGELWVEAAARVSPEAIEIGIGVPFEGWEEAPRQVVSHVARTGDVVLIDDVDKNVRFAEDAYLQARRPRSILCVAMTRRGRLRGILYLEHGQTVGAFSPARVDLLRLVVSQAAISLENTMLHGRLQESNDRLESLVAQRTHELEEANARLEEELLRRALSEEERAALQEQVIRSQELRLAELSAPLMPILRDVLVLPVIGTVDTARARQILEMTLYGAHGAQARMVIVDVTGVRSAGAELGAMLMQLTETLQLLGVEVVLTGLQSQVAQALTNMGVDIGSLVTRGTLESGVLYALARRAKRR